MAVVSLIMQEILKRIEHCKPVISAQKLLEEAEVQEEQAQRISKAAVLFPAPRKAEKRTKPGHVGGSDGRSPTDGVRPFGVCRPTIPVILALFCVILW
jgi:hypothetical protein